MSDTGLTVYSSLRGLFAALFSPGVLLLVGGYGMLAVGPRVLPLAVTVLGAVLAPVSILDYPRHTVFTPDRIERVCYLRSETLSWNDVVAIERAHGSISKWLHVRRHDDSAAGEAERKPPANGGLVARVGKRRYLLADNAESTAEFERLEALVARHAPHVQVRARRPPESTPPSNLYRRTRNP